jgi:nitrite reductase/ring-hydroxylating ferredoxin subunit
VSHDGADWERVASLEEVPEGRAHRVKVAGVEAFVVRSGDAIYALGLRCTHQGTPLDRGVLRLTGTPLTVTCPAHGSMFDLTNGQVRRGPATRPVAVFEARVIDGAIEARPLNALDAPPA